MPSPAHRVHDRQMASLCPPALPSSLGNSLTHLTPSERAGAQGPAWQGPQQGDSPSPPRNVCEIPVTLSSWTQLCRGLWEQTLWQGVGFWES